MSLAELPPVKIKADRNGFTLVPDPAASLDAIIAFMDNRLQQSRDFFQKTEMVLDLRTSPMSTDQICVLYEKLYEKSRVKVVEVRLSDDLSFSMAGEPLKARSASKAAGRERENHAPVIVRNTCRSGTRIVSPSDCIVLGDVNPGAEIIADGDVVVFGLLRGLAHAGAAGDITSRIWALSIEPNQIRIADLVAVPPRGVKPAPNRFEVAEVQNGLIQVFSL
ncbi:putative septum site-determining protein MinC [Syntrophobacter sp. SbD1]|nr:putative septum site-determining protein MinC [Syntrophobacter sp. SbD1]